MVQEPQRRLDCVRGVLTGKKTHLVSLWVSRERVALPRQIVAGLIQTSSKVSFQRGGGEGEGAMGLFSGYYKSRNTISGYY